VSALSALNARPPGDRRGAGGGRAGPDILPDPAAVPLPRGA